MLSIEESDGVLVDELSLFTVPPTSAGIEKTQWVEYRPTTGINSRGPLEFIIPGNTSQYVDLRNTRLHVKAKIVKIEEGKEKSLDENDHVSTINLALQTFWSQVDVSLQQKLVNSSGTNYPYKAYMEAIFGANLPTDTHLQSQLFYKDFVDTIEVSDPEQSGGGLFQRWALTKYSTSFEMEGPLYADICQQDKYILNDVQVGIKLWPTKEEFRLMSSVEDKTFHVRIEEAVLKVCKVTVSPWLLVQHNDLLRKSSALYPYRKTDIKVFTIPGGQFSYSMDDIFQGDVPIKVFAVLVSAEAYNGSFKKNPFVFKHYDLNFAGLYVDGQSVPGRPLQPNFAEGNYIEAYQALLQSTPDSFQFIERDEYNRGYTILAFDVNPTVAPDTWPILQKGNTRLDLKFSHGLPEAVNVILYATFPDTLEIDASRNILQ